MTNIPIERTIPLIKFNHGGTFAITGGYSKYCLTDVTPGYDDGYFVTLANPVENIPFECLTPEFMSSFIRSYPSLSKGTYFFAVWENQDTGLWSIGRAQYSAYIIQAKRVAAMHGQNNLWDIAAKELVEIQ